MDLASHFAGKHALITGGSSGIGAAVASHLGQLGAGVTLVARSPDQLAATAARIEDSCPGSVVRTVQLDVADEAAVKEALPRELAEQPVDLLINCAGVAHAGRLMDIPSEVFRTVMDVNYFGTLWVTRAVLPHFFARGTGAVVNVASQAAIEGIYSYGAYAPSKFAVYGLSQVLRAELRPRGISVSVVLAPNTETPQLAAELEQLPAEMHRVHAVSSVMAPERVAEELLHGLAKRRFEITPGLEGKLLYRLHRTSHRPLRAYFDWQVRRGLAE